MKPAGIVLLVAAVGLSGAGLPRKDVVLIGPLDQDRILDSLPGLARASGAYEPNFRAIDGIHDFAKTGRIRVFLGTWDEDGKASVAAFIKTIEMAFNPAIKVEWIGVSPDGKEPAAALRADGVTKVPTFIVWVDGKERGRIVEAPYNSLEEDLASILLGVPFSDADIDLFRAKPHSHLPIDCLPCHGPGSR